MVTAFSSLCFLSLLALGGCQVSDKSPFFQGLDVCLNDFFYRDCPDYPQLIKCTEKLGNLDLTRREKAAFKYYLSEYKDHWDRCPGVCVGKAVTNCTGGWSVSDARYYKGSCKFVETALECLEEVKSHCDVSAVQQSINYCEDIFQVSDCALSDGVRKCLQAVDACVDMMYYENSPCNMTDTARGCLDRIESDLSCNGTNKILENIVRETKYIDNIEYECDKLERQ